ncbi:MAG: hypothetical protein ACRDD1_15885, partial [Planctomycetia bacterium]
TAGRLWERRPMEERALSFTGRSLDFLRWATAATPRRPDVDEPRRYSADPEKPPTRATVGDELLVFLAYGALRTVIDAAPLRWRPVFVHHPLLRLGYAADFCDPPPSVTGTVQVDADLDWSFWTAGPGEWVLEALEPWLAEQWATAERAMLTQTTSRRSLELGQRRGRTLQEYLDAVDAAGRRDLGRFVLSAAAFDFPSRRSVAALSEVWTDRFRRLSDRVELYRAVQVLPAAVERLGRWQAEARGVGYWDEGYTVAQAWKTDWEAVDGDGLHRRAAEFRRDAEPLAVGGDSSIEKALINRRGGGFGRSEGRDSRPRRPRRTGPGSGGPVRTNRGRPGNDRRAAGPSRRRHRNHSDRRFETHRRSAATPMDRCRTTKNRRHTRRTEFPWSR